MIRYVIASAIAGLAVAASSSVFAQEAFKTPDEAGAALASAARSGDQGALLKVLGNAAKDILDSGDKVADAAALGKFVSAYDAKHQIETKADTAILVVGNDDFPLPIPLVKQDPGWRFDSDKGRKELLARRIGGNELDAIQSCLAYVDAQNEYADLDPAGGGKGTYAQRIVSSSGKKDGLYWPTSDGEQPSPLGELVAEGTREGYRVTGGREPFHGYYFKILTKQGAAATGGELEYVVRGKMIGGFALVAHPATYRNSGVMTFIVSHAGVVYQKDLGPETSAIAARMQSFNPDSSWKKVEPEQQ